MARHRQEAAPRRSDVLGFRPLYSQVRDTLIRRLVEGVWHPGEPLPSEFQLASELGVSQGTVRKALDVMAAEQLVVRRQGRGTFVARPDEERRVFQFFRLVPDHGGRSFPQSEVLSLSSGRSNAQERERLRLDKGARVVRIRRLRSLAGRPTIVETLTLPDALFPGLSEEELPNHIYGLYAMRYGITVSSTKEKLKAVGVDADDARLLGVAPGTPVLQIDRVALSLEHVPVEWRLCVCLTDAAHYVADLG